MHDVADQISERNCCLVIKGGKLTGKALAYTMRAFLATGEKAKTQDVKGKQSLKQLSSDGAKLDNIEVCNATIKSFERVAAKYEVDYAIKTATLDDKPVHLAFFKSKDAATMDSAFREYSAKTLCKSATKPTFRETMSAMREKAKNQVLEKTKEKAHEVVR